jgi:hypothetical protein
MTRPSSEPYYKKRRPLPNNCSKRRTSTSPSMNVPRTSSEKRSPLHPHHGATRTSKPISAGRRGLTKKSMPLDHPSLYPRGTPRRRTNIGRHPRRPVPVPQGYASYPLELQRLQALRWEWSTLPTSTTSPTTRRTQRTSTTSAAGRGGGGAFPRVDGEVNVIFSEHGS